MNEQTFSETQKFKQVWIWVLVTFVMGGALLYLWYGVYQQLYLGRPFGDHPASNVALVAGALFETIMCIVIVAILASIKMVVEAENDKIKIRFFPFKTMEILYGNIRNIRARDYSPLREFGGSGMRRSWNGTTKAFTLSGHRGVELTLRDGGQVMIGSQKADELADFLGSHLIQEAK
jgi:hypothetical protein